VSRRGAISTALALFAAASAAVSLPSSRVAWTVETVKLVRAGDPVRGRQLNGDCSGCHGEAGIVDTPDVSNLAGQDPFYTYKQLQDYKSELRSSPIMGEAVKPLSDRDMADLAAFYAALAPSPSPPSPPAVEPGIERLVTFGDGARLIPACDACHGPGGDRFPGSYGVPTLRGQKFDDLSLQLTTYRSGERANDVYRVMRDLCRDLTDAEIAGLAAYYSGTAPTKPDAPAPPAASPGGN
jgi:cytochrome c553